MLQQFERDRTWDGVHFHASADPETADDPVLFHFHRHGDGSAYWLARLIEKRSMGVTPTDPVTFASVALVLLAVALIECYLPARRAARLDRMAALRCE